MKTIPSTLLLLLIAFTNSLLSQIAPYKENLKWGVKENDKIIVPAVYDTVFGYDSTGKVCLACFKTKTASASKFIKLTTLTYYCNYLNNKGGHLTIKTEENDTCSVFSFGKSSLKQYKHKDPLFTVASKGKKYLADKNFNQLSYKGYYDINPSADPGFYTTQYLSEAEILFTGLVNTKEDEIIPYQYSNIKVNPNDSVIIACSAGVRTNASDDVFNYDGKKREVTYRHLDMATKNFLIHQIFEPKEYFIIYNIKTKEEKNINADEVQPYNHDEILVRIKHDWFIYDMNTHEKKALKQH
jgi:hypothetical protein